MTHPKKVPFIKLPETFEEQLQKLLDRGLDVPDSRHPFSAQLYRYYLRLQCINICLNRTCLDANEYSKVGQLGWRHHPGGGIGESVAADCAGIAQGDSVEVIAEDGQITIKSRTPEYTLDALIEATPSEAVERSDEDNAWLEMPSVGKELD